MSIILFKGDNFTVEVYDTSFSFDRYVCKACLPYKNSLGTELIVFTDFDKDVKLNSSALRKIENVIYSMDDRVINKILGYDPLRFFKELGWIEE